MTTRTARIPVGAPECAGTRALVAALSLVALACGPDAPVEFSASGNPVFDGDYAWAVTRDELDVQRVGRYRIVR